MVGWLSAEAAFVKSERGREIGKLGIVTNLDIEKFKSWFTCLHENLVKWTWRR